MTDPERWRTPARAHPAPTDTPDRGRSPQRPSAGIRRAFPQPERRGGRTDGRRRRLWPATLLASAAGAAIVSMVPPTTVSANGPADADLFSLTNQDRVSNGVGSLQGQSTLGAIAENLPYSGCGFTVDGRSQDMITRNYFSHPILGCGGKLVFSMMQANAIHYTSAGENIGWCSGTADAASSASYINGQFMNSPEHRSNILNGGYTHVGIGTAQSDSWSGAGGTYTDVWMFSEEFAALASAPPPTPLRTPVPPRPPRPVTTPLPPRNAPAPPPPPVPPATTEQPTAAPTAPVVPPSPVPSPETAPSPPPDAGSGTGLAPLPAGDNLGLLSGSIEAVLEAYLVD